MPTWRVGVGGLLVTDRDGRVTVLDAGTLLDEVPLAYDGRLEAVVLDEVECDGRAAPRVVELDTLDDLQAKRRRGYADKRLGVPEDK